MLLSVIVGMLFAILLLIVLYAIRYLIRRHQEDAFLLRLKNTIVDAIQEATVQQYYSYDKQNKND